MINQESLTISHSGKQDSTSHRNMAHPHFTVLTRATAKVYPILYTFMFHLLTCITSMHCFMLWHQFPYWILPFHFP